MELFLTTLLAIVLVAISFGYLRNRVRKNIYSIAEMADNYVGPLSKVKKNERILYICSGDDFSLLNRTKSENIIFYDIEHKTKLKSARAEQIKGNASHLYLKDSVIDKIYIHPLEVPMQEIPSSRQLCNEVDRVLKSEGEIILDMEWGRRSVSFELIDGQTKNLVNPDEPFEKYYQQCIEITDFFKSKGYKSSKKMLGNYVVLKKTV